MRAHMDQDPNIEAFTSDGWLRTGDKGYIDDHNYLCLSGRYKEIINRGGEKISPFEVENVCRQMKLEALDVNKSQVTSWDATSGLALPIEASSQKPIKTAVDSLGKARDANDAKMQDRPPRP
eukprot:g27729.t1